MSIEDDSAAVIPKKKKSVRKAGKAKKAKKGARAKQSKSPDAGMGGTAKFPRHTVEKALRIPKAIIEQNAGGNAPRLMRLRTPESESGARSDWK
jgi:hypothetical protein